MPSPRKATPALRMASPEVFFQTNWKASLSNQMFSPLPVRVYWPAAGSKVAEPLCKTAPISPLPVKIPSEASPEMYAANARAIGANSANRTSNRQEAAKKVKAKGRRRNIGNLSEELAIEKIA